MIRWKRRLSRYRKRSATFQQNWEHGVDDVNLVRYRIDEVSDSLQHDSL